MNTWKINYCEFIIYKILEMSFLLNLFGDTEKNWCWCRVHRLEVVMSSAQHCLWYRCQMFGDDPHMPTPTGGWKNWNMGPQDGFLLVYINTPWIRQFMSLAYHKKTQTWNGSYPLVMTNSLRTWKWPKLKVDLPIKSWKIPSYGRWWIFPNFALDRNVYQAWRAPQVSPLKPRTKMCCFSSLRPTMWGPQDS
jgi:hypothetical protein